MIVYHYLNRKWGLQSIERRRLRISIIHTLQDPFELRAILVPEHAEPGLEQMIESIAQPDTNNKFGRGIICFSETCDSPVMWSMYAHNHEGVCLGFEVPEQLGALYKVEYVPNRIPPPMDMQSMIALITHKFDDWQYERERRLFIALQEANREGEHYFALYEPGRLELRSVIVGFKSDITRADVTNRLGDSAAGVDVFRVRRSLTDFSMVRDTTGGW